MLAVKKSLAEFEQNVELVSKAIFHLSNSILSDPPELLNLNAAINGSLKKGFEELVSR